MATPECSHVFPPNANSVSRAHGFSALLPAVAGLCKRLLSRNLYMSQPPKNRKQNRRVLKIAAKYLYGSSFSGVAEKLSAKQSLWLKYKCQVSSLRARVSRLYSPVPFERLSKWTYDDGTCQKETPKLRWPFWCEMLRRSEHSKFWTTFENFSFWFLYAAV